MKKVLLASVILLLATVISCSSGDDTKMFNVAVSVSPNATGTISPSADSMYEEGQVISLKANALDTYSFSGWSGDKESNSNPLSIKVDQNYSLIANFSLKQYQLAITINGEGTVNEKVLEQKSKKYEHGTMVELTAVPAQGWKFKEWQGAIANAENPVQLTVVKPEEVTAVFERKSYDLTVTTSGEGAVHEEVVQQKTTSHKYGALVKLTASPSKGWKFSEWSGDQTGSENPIQITVDTTKQITAKFEKKYFPVTLDIQGEGTVTKNPDQNEYIFGSTLELTANPSRGYKFVDWQGDISSPDNPVLVTVDTAKVIAAVFDKKSYPVTINTSGQGVVTKVPDQQEYKFNSVVDMTASPSEGWKFVRWEGDTTSTQPNLQIVVDNAKEYKAVFEPIPYTVDITINGSGSASKELISGSSLADGYSYGSRLKITITEPQGWNFVYWDGDLTGTDNPIEITISDSVTATANMDESPFAGGNGSKKYPYEVSTLEQLQAINDFTDSHFIQINDIDATETINWNGGKGFQPIGDNILKFSGSYNGNGFTIYNLNINRPNENYVALFGYAEEAELNNIALKAVLIQGDYYTAGLVGNNLYGEVTASSVTGEVYGYVFVGGLVGWNIEGVAAGGGIISNSYTNIRINDAYNEAGCLVGKNFNGTINNSYAFGEILSNGNRSLGGLVGYNGGKVNNSFSDCDVSGKDQIGGLAGYHSGEIKNSYSLGVVKGQNIIGGLVGANNEGKISYSYSSGYVEGESDTGGLVGLSSGSISYSYWDSVSSNQANAVGRGNSDGTTGLTTSEMTGTSAETNMPAFDWVNLWVTTGGYPALSWE